MSQFHLTVKTLVGGSWKFKQYCQPKKFVLHSYWKKWKNETKYWRNADGERHNMLEGIALYLSKKMHTPLRSSQRVLGCLVDLLSLRHYSEDIVEPWGQMYDGGWLCFTGLAWIQYGMPNGVCYFDLFAIFCQIFLILK